MADKPTTLTPKLRFPEFEKDGPWSTRPLERLAQRVTTRNLDGAHTRVLTNSAERGVLDQRDYFDREIASAGSIDTYYVVERGDYVYNPRTSTIAPVGPISRNNLGTGVMSPLYTVFRFADDRTDFFEHYFRSTAWHSYLRQISSTGARHDRMSITSSAFMRMPIPTPNHVEQRRIAACLTSLDECIAAEGRKLEALRAHKKGLMQQLFPREGETRPRLRFPEYRDGPEWTRRALKQVTRSFQDGDWIESKDQSATGVRLIQTGNIGLGTFIPKQENARYISEETFARLDCTEVFPGDCLISRLPDPLGRACLIPDLGLKMITAVDCTIARFDPSEVVPYLFVSYSQTDQYFNEVEALASGSTRTRISRTNLEDLEVPLTEIGEQQRIAACLSSLDGVITAQSRKLNGLRAHKKGLLQQLFPAPEGE